ncbi:hypothetical protein CLF_106242 [Clonorchis sinensis]|uniref:Serine-threonine/tyrosine-protein kinase catalytic domain-containing protein n=1 Tax=Clonorchis sinensis TaxID=79923 RepID=G7YEV4_CLOSI|nr:hypothetical protein CLF_106242 [Clonorchis sinensis]
MGGSPDFSEDKTVTILIVVTGRPARRKSDELTSRRRSHVIQIKVSGVRLQMRICSRFAKCCCLALMTKLTDESITSKEGVSDGQVKQKEAGYEFSTLARLQALSSVQVHRVGNLKRYLRSIYDSSACMINEPRLTMNPLIKMGFQILNAVKFVHKRKIIHNDIAARNCICQQLYEEFETSEMWLLLPAGYRIYKCPDDLRNRLIIRLLKTLREPMAVFNLRLRPYQIEHSAEKDHHKREYPVDSVDSPIKTKLTTSLEVEEVRQLKLLPVKTENGNKCGQQDHDVYPHRLTHKKYTNKIHTVTDSSTSINLEELQGRMEIRHNISNMVSTETLGYHCSTFGAELHKQEYPLSLLLTPMHFKMSVFRNLVSSTAERNTCYIYVVGLRLFITDVQFVIRHATVHSAGEWFPYCDCVFVTVIAVSDICVEILAPRCHIIRSQNHRLKDLTKLRKTVEPFCCLLNVEIWNKSTGQKALSQCSQILNQPTVIKTQRRLKAFVVRNVLSGESAILRAEMTTWNKPFSCTIVLLLQIRTDSERLHDGLLRQFGYTCKVCGANTAVSLNIGHKVDGNYVMNPKMGETGRGLSKSFQQPYKCLLNKIYCEYRLYYQLKHEPVFVQQI